VIEDEEAIPAKFKTITVTMPLEDWQSVIDLIMSTDSAEWPNISITDVKTTITISKHAIAEAIEAGKEVPGADIRWGQMRLSV